MAKRIPRLDEITDTTPLRLDVAAALAFPDGSMGASGLRREAAKGRLAVERIAGKDYTTLQAIENMRELCRVPPKAPACGSAPRAATPPAGSRTRPHGSSSTPGSNIPLESARMIVQELRERSPTNKRRS
jgi:hypothetical protein